MPTAAEMLSGVQRAVKETGRAAQKAGNAVVLPTLDHFEQSARRDRDFKERPLTESERAWDEMMEIHRKGGSIEEVEAAGARFQELRDKAFPRHPFAIQDDMSDKETR